MICSYATPQAPCLAEHELITSVNSVRYLCTKHLNEYLDGVDLAVEKHPKWDVEPRALLIGHLRPRTS